MLKVSIVIYSAYDVWSSHNQKNTTSTEYQDVGKAVYVSHLFVTDFGRLSKQRAIEDDERTGRQHLVNSR